MNLLLIILLIMGGFFIMIGGTITAIFFTVGMGIFSLIPMFFIVIGLVMVIVVIVLWNSKRAIKKKGTRYAAKIYSYVENRAYTINNVFTVNTVVHYWDRSGVERETIIPTAFAKGSREYPIGMTIDIYEYNGKFDFDKNSVRNETLPREQELMDDKPIDRAMIRMTAVTCNSCGATYEGVQGYTAKCPYCGGVTNAR